ncbi:MAG: toprim domain-containing protein, partial [Proteobacteria bacterium]|nr:toprim domain-containing protein [Pseudomonadota bacterium]
MRHSSSNTDDLAGTLIAYGLDVRSIEADGKIRRVDDNQHAKRRNGHGWYRADIDRETGVLFAAYGSWSRGDGVGETHTWTSRGRGQAVTVDWDRVERARAAKAAKRAAKTANAAKAAEGLLDAATAATEHPYLTAKGIQANGALVDHAGRLLLPIRDLAGGLLGLQTIATDGDKRFLKGTDRTTPGCFIIGDPAGAAIVAVVEGFATGASVHEATRWPVLVAFDAGGLTKIAAPLRAVLPDAVMVFAGDNDASEVGQTAVRKAAEVAGGVDTVPPAVATDWNDHAALHGLEAVRVLLAEAAKATPRSPRDAKGRFTGSGAYEVEPKPCEPLPTVDEAQAAVKARIEAYWAEARIYDAESDDPPPILAIAAGAGVGKSTITRAIAAADLPLAGDAVYQAPTHRLATEAARQTDGHVTQGRTAESCERFDMVADVVRSGLSVTSTLCFRVTRDPQTGLPNGPPQVADCYTNCALKGHWAQWAGLPEDPQLRYRPTAYATAYGDGSGRSEAVLIYDEAIWSAFTRVDDIPLDLWHRPRINQEEAKNLTAALEAGDMAGFLSTWQEASLLAFAEEENPATWLHKYPSATDPTLKQALKNRLDAHPLAGRMAKVWTILAETKAASLAVTERLRIVRDVPQPGTGERRDVLRLTWLREPARARPVLLLDADASPLITERLFPGMEIVKAPAEPNAYAVQVVDKTMSKNALLGSDQLRAEAVSLVRSEVWRDKQAAGSGVLVGATRAVVKRLFEDAGHCFDGMEAAAISTFMQETALHGARWIWFGSAALGRNDWSDCTTVIILGREELAPEALEDLARALFGDSGEPLQFMDPEAPNFPEVEARYVMRDGSGRAVMVRRHPDGRIAEIQTQVRECATRQLIE